MLVMSMDDWLEDLERVKRASPQARAHAIGELDKALRHLEANPADNGMFVSTSDCPIVMIACTAHRRKPKRFGRS